MVEYKFKHMIIFKGSTYIIKVSEITLKEKTTWGTLNENV